MTNPGGASPETYLLDGWDGVLFGASSGGISGLQDLTQAAVMAAKQALIEGNEVLSFVLGLIFEGLRNGIPLALAIIEGIIVKLFGLIPGFTRIEDALNAIGEVPFVADIVQSITGTVGGTLHDIETWAASLGSDVSGAAAKLAALISAVGGTVIGDVSDAINAANGDIAELIDGVEGLGIDDVVGKVILIQQIIDGIANALGHPGTGHSILQLIAYVENIPATVITSVFGGPDLGADVQGFMTSLGSVWPKTFPFTFGVSTNTTLGSFVPQSQFQQLLDGLAGQTGAQVHHAVAAVQQVNATAQSQLSQLILDGVNDVNPAIGGGVFGAISGTIGAGESILATAGTNAQSAVAQLVDATENAIGGAGAATTAFGQAIGTVHDNATDAVGQLEDATVNAIGGAADATTAFGQAVAVVSGNAANAVGQIDDIIVGAGEATAAAVGGALATAGTSAAAAVANISTIVTNSGAGSVAAAGTLLQTADTNAAAAVSNISTIVTNSGAGTVAAAGTLLQTAGANAQGLVAGINNAAAGLLTGGSALVADAEANFAALFAGPAQFLQGLSGVFGQQANNDAYAAAAAQSAAHAAEIAAQQSAFNAVFNVGPSTAGNINVTADFTGITNQTGMSGIMLPGTSSGAGFMGVTSGQAAFQGGTSFLGDYEVFPTQTVSDYQVIDVTLGTLNDLLSGLIGLTIPFRVNSARTVYNSVLLYSSAGVVYANLSGFSGSGSTFATSAAGALSSIATGGKLRIIAGDPSSLSPYAFQVVYNSTPIITYTDGSHIVTVGSGQRYVGLAMQSVTSGKFPPGVKMVTYQDNPPPPSSYPYSGLPTAGTKGRQYWPNDVGLALRDNGSAWESIWGGVLGAFTPPTAGASSVLQSGASITADKGARLITAPSNGADKWNFEYDPLSSASNYAHTAYFEVGAIGASNMKSGMVLYNSSSTKLIGWGICYDSGKWQLGLYQYTNPTTLSATVGLKALGADLIAIPNWLGIADDGTNRYYQYSYNGVDFETAFTETRATFMTPDSIGRGATNGTGSTALVRCRSSA